MKKMMVTGATGFLGSRVADFFSGKYDVYAPTHGEMDITDEESVVRIVEKYEPDIILHCAAISDISMCERAPEKSWKINVDGSIHIAKASKKINAKCIMCSSDQVYFGNFSEEARREDEELRPSNLYGREKLTAEQECLRINPNCVLLRLSWMYDVRTVKEGDHGDFFSGLLPKIKTDEMLYYSVCDKRGITDVNEVIQNLEKTFEIAGGVYNFGSPNDKNAFETVWEVFTNLGLDRKRLQENEEAFQDNPRNISMCQDKIRNCGIIFSSTVEGLTENLRMALKQTK